MRAGADISESFGVVVGGSAGEARTHPAGECVEERRALRAQVEPLEDAAGHLTAAEPVEQLIARAEAVPGARVASGDVAVDRYR